MFSSSNTIARLQKQSNNALTAFTKIVTDLTSNNKEVDSEIETLNTIKTSNDKVINKIQKFLSDED